MKITSLLLLSSASGVDAFSAFTSSSSPSRVGASAGMSMVMYSDPATKNEPGGGSGGCNTMYKALMTTEQWMTRILGKPDQKNPLTRQEVNYVCELGDDDALVASAMWRRLRKARELGMEHGREQETMLRPQRKSNLPNAFRQIEVVVIPNSKSCADPFYVFDQLVETINKVRQRARTYVTDISFEEDVTTTNKDWQVVVNCAHLHPNFGDKNAQSIVNELERRNARPSTKDKYALGRRSPYPTVVVEVLSAPPSDTTYAEVAEAAMLGQRKSPPTISKPTATTVETEERNFGMDDRPASMEKHGDFIRQLNAMYAGTAQLQKEQTLQKMMKKTKKSKRKVQEEGALWEALSNSFGAKGIAQPVETLKSAAEKWVSRFDEAFDIYTSTFTSSDAKHIDAAHEFVFTNLAMHVNRRKSLTFTRRPRQYLVFNNFMSTSATYFDCFAEDVASIIDVLPTLAGEVDVQTYHPEHRVGSRMSPVPMIVLEWKPSAPARD